MAGVVCCSWLLDKAALKGALGTEKPRLSKEHRLWRERSSKCSCSSSVGITCCPIYSAGWFSEDKDCLLGPVRWLSRCVGFPLSLITWVHPKVPHSEKREPIPVLQIVLWTPHACCSIHSYTVFFLSLLNIIKKLSDMEPKNKDSVSTPRWFLLDF